MKNFLLDTAKKIIIENLRLLICGLLTAVVGFFVKNFTKVGSTVFPVGGTWIIVSCGVFITVLVLLVFLFRNTSRLSEHITSSFIQKVIE